MARIKIDTPKPILFETTVTVTISDINYGQHLGNDKVLSMMHESRLRFVKSLGYKNEVSIEGNIGIIISDSAIEYKAEGFYGDEIINQIGISDQSKYGFDMLYLLIRKSDQKTIAKGKTGVLFFDYGIRKLSPVPESFTKRIDELNLNS